MSSFEDYSAAMATREIIKALVRETIDEVQPPYRYAQVASIDRTNRVATVTFPEGGGAVTVQMGSLQPLSVGQIVRVSGRSGDRYIADVIGSPFIAGQYYQRGTQAVVFSGVAANNVTVTFPVAFTSIPVIVATAEATSSFICFIVSRSTTTSVIQVVTWNQAAFTGTIVLNWAAFL